jgi:AcrR family transcriptional regulator
MPAPDRRTVTRTRLAPGPRRRRTQAERRAATRGALLDAALACLEQEGYANLTTRNVAERAGVSQGTQMHYFPTRQAFVAEVVRHVALKLVAELGEQDGLRARSGRRRVEELLNRVWEIHSRPAFRATMELWVAGRTDQEIGAAIREVARDVDRMVSDAAGELCPELGGSAAALELLDMSLATMRGLSVLYAAGEDGDVERRWRAARARLLALYDNL